MRRMRNAEWSPRLEKQCANESSLCSTALSAARQAWRADLGSAGLKMSLVRVGRDGGQRPPLEAETGAGGWRPHPRLPEVVRHEAGMAFPGGPALVDLPR